MRMQLMNGPLLLKQGCGGRAMRLCLQKMDGVRDAPASQMNVLVSLCMNQLQNTYRM